MWTYLGLVLLVPHACCLYTTAANDKPIIGVLAQETGPKRRHYGDTYIPAPYVKYLQMAGARVVPVRVKEPMEYYQYMFKSLNGILFPGGGNSLTTSEMAKTATVFYKFAIAANDANDYFPIWGTCQGFELLTVITAGKNPMSNFDSFDIAMPLYLSKNFRISRLLGQLPEDVYKYLTTENVTENFHVQGITPETFSSSQELSQFYQVLSTNFDKQGKEFISTMEAYKYPIYAVQWHPEKPNLFWNMNYHINHGAHAIRVSQYMANFFVAEARKSGHGFPSTNEENDALIENYVPYFHKDDGTSDINYYFNFTRYSLE